LRRRGKGREGRAKKKRRVRREMCRGGRRAGMGEKGARLWGMDQVKE